MRIVGAEPSVAGVGLRLFNANVALERRVRHRNAVNAEIARLLIHFCREAGAHLARRVGAGRQIDSSVGIAVGIKNTLNQRALLGTEPVVRVFESVITVFFECR